MCLSVINISFVFNFDFQKFIMFDSHHMSSIIILSICDWGIFIFSTHFIKFCFLLVDILILYECGCR